MKFKFFLLIALLVFKNTTAQDVYNFQVLNENYQNLTNTISLNNNQTWDDPAYTIPLGFQFQIANYSINSINVVEDGYGGVLSNIQSLDTGTGAFIVPVFQDIVDLGFTGGTSLSNISYKVEGTNGARIFKLEYNNVGFLDDDTTSDFINYQVWLYESTNVIEFRYGPSQINNPVGSFEDLSGLGIGLFPSLMTETGTVLSTCYTLSGDPENPMVTAIEPGQEIDEFSLNGNPNTGIVYRFTPGILNTQAFETTNFKIYPNPVKDVFSIQTKEPINRMFITNTLGVNVFTRDARFDNINISELPSGVYFITIITNNARTTKRLIKV